MYTPAHFRESRLSTLHALIQAYPFATLAGVASAGIEAVHLPLLLSGSDGPFGALHGHVARANPVWRTLGNGSEVLAIFQGPNRYISPNWYPSKHEHGKVVPTWNYLVVHARGSIRWIDDPEWVRRHVEETVRTHESHQDHPWSVADAPRDFITRMLGGIVGFEVRVASMDGKWKLSQNRNPADRLGVIEGLQNQSNTMAAEMAEWMRSLEGAAEDDKT